jgi:hypothetical protein
LRAAFSAARHVVPPRFDLRQCGVCKVRLGSGILSCFGARVNGNDVGRKLTWRNRVGRLARWIPDPRVTVIDEWTAESGPLKRLGVAEVVGQEPPPAAVVHAVMDAAGLRQPR